MDIPAATQELIDHLKSTIREAEARAYEDCERYEEDCRERIRDRRERLHAELSPVRAALDQVFRNLADIEMMKPPIVITTEHKD